MARTEAYRVNFKRRGNPYIMNEDINHFWDSYDVQEIVERWNEGQRLEDIAKDFRRDPDEVFLLLFDQARKGKINRFFAKRI